MNKEKSKTLIICSFLLDHDLENELGAFNSILPLYEIKNQESQVIIHNHP